MNEVRQLGERAISIGKALQQAATEAEVLQHLQEARELINTVRLLLAPEGRPQ